MTIAAALAVVINLPGIVGAFLAGLAVNAAVHDQAAKEKLKFFGDSLFIPIFFVVTGFLIDPREFYRSIMDNLALAAAVILALLTGKWIAAQLAGRAFGYSPIARMTIWSLTLPQVAATLAATLVAFDTFDPRRSSPGRRPVAQCCARAHAYHFHSRAGSDRTFCASHASASETCKGGLGDPNVNSP